jgi:DNA-binding MarR family transcriptional regulator
MEPASATATASTLPGTSIGSRSDDRELIERIVAQVEATLRHLRCAASDRLVREGVSMVHLRALWLLEEHGELAMSGLGDLLGVSMSNATGIVDRMEERGLVERVRVTDDRRVVHVRPTPRGVELARTIEVLRGDLMERVLGRLDDVQIARVARVVEDIRAAVFASPLVVDPMQDPDAGLAAIAVAPSATTDIPSAAR